MANIAPQKIKKTGGRRKIYDDFSVFEKCPGLFRIPEWDDNEMVIVFINLINTY